MKKGGNKGARLPQNTRGLRQVYTVTVGRKPSQAGFYGNNVADIELVGCATTRGTRSAHALGLVLLALGLRRRRR